MKLRQSSAQFEQLIGSTWNQLRCLPALSFGPALPLL
jgi:hypothetical protein